jgi:hypothetical protein
MARSATRRAGKAGQKLEGRPKVYLPVPEEFLDIMGEPWSSMRAGVITDMDLPEVLMFTVRHAPVKNGGDALRTLDCFLSIKEAPDGVIEMVRDDWDWMLSHFKEMAHNVWKAPDAAYLVRWLENNVQQTPPTE